MVPLNWTHTALVVFSWHELDDLKLSFSFIKVHSDPFCLAEVELVVCLFYLEAVEL